MLEAAAQIGRLKKPRDKETFAVATIFRSGLPSSCHHHKMFKSSREVSNCVVDALEKLGKWKPQKYGTEERDNITCKWVTSQCALKIGQADKIAGKISHYGYAFGRIIITVVNTAALLAVDTSLLQTRSVGEELYAISKIA